MYDNNSLSLLANAEVICALLEDVNITTDVHRKCATKTCRFVGIIPSPSNQRIIDCYEALRPQVLTYFATMPSTYSNTDNKNINININNVDDDDDDEDKSEKGDNTMHVCFPNAARWLLLLTYLIYNSPAHYAAWKDRRQMLLSLPVVRQVLHEKVHLVLPVPAICLTELYKTKKNDSITPTGASVARQEENNVNDDNNDINSENTKEKIEAKEALENFTRLQKELDMVVRQWLPSVNLLEPMHVHLESELQEHYEQERLKKSNVDEMKNINASILTRQRELADIWRVIAWELSTTAVFLTVEHKNFQIWHHRRALLANGLSLLEMYITLNQSNWHEVIHNSIEFDHVLSSICGVDLSCINEVDKTTHVLTNIDAKNYHVWLYRHWLLHAFPFHLNIPPLQQIITFYRSNKNISSFFDMYRDTKERESGKLVDEEPHQQQQVEMQNENREKLHYEYGKTTSESVNMNCTSWLELVLAEWSEQDNCHAYDGMHKELHFTSELIANDCWNNSAWCHRFRLIRDDVIATWLTEWVEQQFLVKSEIMLNILESMISASDLVEFVRLVCEEEIYYTLYYLSEYPSNEAAYTYARSIAQVGQQGTLLVHVMDHCTTHCNNNSTSNQEKDSSNNKKSKLLSKLHSLIEQSKTKRSGDYDGYTDNYDDHDIDRQLTLKEVIVLLLNCNYASYDNYVKSVISQQQMNKEEEKEFETEEQQHDQVQDQFTQTSFSDSHTTVAAYKKVMEIIHLYMTEVQALSGGSYVPTLQMPLTLLYKLQRFTLPHVNRVLTEWHENIKKAAVESTSITRVSKSQEETEEYNQELSQQQMPELQNTMENNTQETIKSASQISPLHDERYNEVKEFFSHNAQYVYDNLYQIYAAQYHICYNVLCQMWNNYFADNRYRHELEVSHSPDMYVTRGVNAITTQMLQDILSLVKQMQTRKEQELEQYQSHVFKSSEASKEPSEADQVASDSEEPLIKLFVQIEGCALSLAKRLVYDDGIRGKYWKHEIYNILFRHYD